MNTNECKKEASITRNGGVEQEPSGEDYRPSACSPSSAFMQFLESELKKIKATGILPDYITLMWSHREKGKTMSKTYPCPAEVEDDCGYPTCAHAAQCERAAKERLARTACSRSLDVFESWEQFCRVKITGYTLRDGTDVCRFNFPTGKPNARTTDSMNLLIKNGWQITAIHYENAPAKAASEPK